MKHEAIQAELFLYLGRYTRLSLTCFGFLAKKKPLELPRC